MSKGKEACRDEKEEADDLMVNIMTMMLKVQKCPEAWKESKVVILPKQCSEEEKDKHGNWMPITLTSILYRIVFGEIAEYSQLMHRRKTFNGDGIMCKEQKVS
jgi:hypothetical protein